MPSTERSALIAAAAAIILVLDAFGAAATPISRMRSATAEYLRDGVADPSPDSAMTGPTVLPIGPPGTIPPDSLSARRNVRADRLGRVELPPPGADPGGYARAGITIDDHSFAAVEGSVNESVLPRRHALRAEVRETIAGENATGAVQNILFSFRLENMKVEIWDDTFDGVAPGPNPFDGPSDAIGMSFWYSVSRGPVTLFETVFEAWGNQFQFTDFVTSGVDGLDPDSNTISKDLTIDLPNVIGGPVGTKAVPRILPFLDRTVDDLWLGTVGPGGSYEVTAAMGAALILPGERLDAGGRVTIGDPNALGFGGGLGDVTLRPATGVVPLPAAGWLLLGGLGALAARRRRAR